MSNEQRKKEQARAREKSLSNGDVKGRKRTKRAINTTGNRLIYSKEQGGLVV